jgi:hypothetical protein
MTYVLHFKTVTFQEGRGLSFSTFHQTVQLLHTYGSNDLPFILANQQTIIKPLHSRTR